MVGEVSQVVVGAGVALEELCSLLVPSLLLGVVALEGSTVEHFLNVELAGVGLELVYDLLVGAADDVVVGDEACTAQLGQYAFCELVIDDAHVADLLFALGGIFIHGEDAQDDVLVLDVALADELLEAFPVLGSELRVDVGLHAVLLQLLVDVGAGGVLALLGQLGVEVVAAFGRSVGADLDVLQLQCLLVVVDFLEDLHEVLDAGAVKLAGAHVGLVDEILDLCFLLLLDDALVGIGCEGGIHAGQCVLEQLAGGHDAVAHLEVGQGDALLALLGVEAQVEVALLHGVDVGEGSAHGVVAASLIGHGGAVAEHFLALECRGSRCGFAAVVLQHGCHAERHLFLHILLGECDVDRSRHFAAYGLERSGGYAHVVGAQLLEFAARSEHESAHGSDRENSLFTHT